jgi:hypothetical protein
MPVFSASFTTTGNPYNWWSVVTGGSTTGVTKKTGTVTKPTSMSVNWRSININNDAGNTSVNIFFGDATVTTTTGTDIAVGGSFQDRAQLESIALTDKWFAVSGTMVVNLEWH